MNTPDHKTPQEKPTGPSRGVFGYDVSRKRAFWREMGQSSVLLFAAVTGIGAVIIALSSGWYMDWRSHVKVQRVEPEPVVTPVEPEPVPTHRRLVDGVAVADDQPISGRFYAVMLDNLVDARPQSGLSKARVIYEAPVEGGVTRFMAVFSDDEAVEKIGPVRSARPYFLDWSEEYDAMYVHVGGSPEALDKITSFKVRDLNEFYNGPSFWRDRARFAPHNVYTSTERLEEAFGRKFTSREPDELDPWKFKDDAAEADRGDTKTVVVDYGYRSVNVVWTYDRAANLYRRAQGGTVSRDGTEQLTAKNVLVQEVKVAILDNVGRRRIDTITEGDATAFIDGMAFHGTWKKSSRDGRTRFYDGAGNELELNAGQTWIQVVPIGTDVTETKTAAQAASEE